MGAIVEKLINISPVGVLFFDSFRPVERLTTAAAKISGDHKRHV